jgi:polyferredoxin
MVLIQKIGLALFLLALLLFTATLGLDRYELSEEKLAPAIDNKYHLQELVRIADERGALGEAYGSSFEYVPVLKNLLEAAGESLAAQAEEGVPEGVSRSDFTLPDWKMKDYILPATKQASVGPVSRNPLLFLLLTVGLGIFGGLLYILPKFNLLPGIKHDHIYHRSMTRGLNLGIRGFFLGLTIVGVLLYGVFYMGKDYFWPGVTLGLGLIITALVFYYQRSVKHQPAKSASPDVTGWVGVLTGIYLITFYVLLYWAPQHITSWMVMADPLSQALNGGEASQWFIYGLLYTVVILVMGVRMFAKYQHNKYQQIRTASVMFFQTAFAFLIPEIMVRLNYPYYDFKNIWPLNYTFFFDWNLNSLISSGALGVFMLGWGIALILLGVPIITYFYGKRWYCSWVCGCGGLAETLGDPYRQLSDKSLRSWQYERWIIHGVLVFAVIMTMGVLYSYLPKNDVWFNQRNFLILMMVLLSGAAGYAYYRWRAGTVDISKLGIYVGVGVTVVLVGISAYHLATGSEQFFFLSSGSTRQWYGFLVGSAFAGVVGTGFYPLMGNRVWCRFGCPLAAYLGLVQRFKSRFRITTNGGQCISCGNCSTYCEMGIDVRWYAQRGQDIIRSSCVGCGVCSAVCPRGVLRLENSSADIDTRAEEQRVLQVSEKDGVVLRD